MKLLAAIFIVLGLAQVFAAQSDRPVTFDRDIAPIIFKNCAACHRPGESGPFPLLTYADVKSHAQQVAIVTKTKFMPPWLPGPSDFKIADRRGLTSAQIALIERWVSQGALEGNPKDLLPRPQFTNGWQLGPPDLVLTAERAYTLAAGGPDQYWNFLLRVPIDRTRWVKAVEIRPADKRLVHHANLLVDTAQSARQMELSPGAGFGGMEINLESKVFDPDSHFLFWKPGSFPYVEPDGMALRLDPGSDLVLNLHLQPSGKPEQIQPSVGIYFTDKPATQHPMLLQIQNDRALDIPPGVPDFVVTSDFKLPVDVDLLAIYPHAHYLGKDLLATATFPNGTKKTLIHIPDWDLKWQGVFRYAKPVSLPKGTTIAMRYVYDNSEENVANPNHPPKRVTAGNAATDEMSHLWLQVLPKNFDPAAGDPRRLLMEAMARRTLENDPTDFASNYNLAAMLQAKGDWTGALAYYEAAIHTKPDNPFANNAAGGALLAMDRASDAVPYFRNAIAKRGDYFDAHYNLALALHALGESPETIEELKTCVGLSPGDAAAHANLGAALAEAGRLAEAKAELEKAIALDPNQPLARENLAAIKEQQ